MTEPAMDSLVLMAPGDLRIERRPVPVPGPGEVRVRVEFAGICGSDIHYYRHGGYGSVRMPGPMVLGHEIAGRVDALGPGAGGQGVAVGDRVAVDPSQSCGYCDACRDGNPRFCDHMRFMGSALRLPPVEGGFSQFVTCSVSRAVPLTGAAGRESGALCEPLAVALHAVDRLGPPGGRRLLIAGFGPIGALAFLAARQRGFERISVTDLAPAPLALAERLGADRVFDLAQGPATPAAFQAAMECSGHPDAMRALLVALTRRGHMVQVGLMTGDVPISANDVSLRELRIEGSFRFDREFREAAALISSGRIDVAPLVTDVLNHDQAVEALDLAQDRTRSIKVLLRF